MKIPVISSILEKGFLADLNERIQDAESQRRLVLVIVCIALLLDNMLYMVIVPIIPIYLDELKADELAQLNAKTITNNDAIADQQFLYNNNEETNINRLLQPPVTQNAKTKNLPQKSGGKIRVRLRRRTTANPFNSSYYNDSVWQHHRDKNLVGKTVPLLVKYSGDESSDARVGVLFASKALIQLFISPISGTVIDRIGYETPMIIGLSIIFFSTTIFAFGRSYAVLFVARSLQGVGSAFADTSGLAMIADRYKEDAARSRAQGIALAFISFGCLFAPPFGGFFYKYAGKAVPFLMLSLIALVDGVMLKLVSQPTKKEKQTLCDNGLGKKGTPIYKLILDPYIALCAGALVMANVSLAFLEPTIARWMKDTMKADEFQIGAVWLPAFVPHVIGVYVTVKLAKIYPKHQWLITAVGLTLEGLSCLIIPFCSNFGMVILPLMIDCFGIALVDTAILPSLAYLVDHRHVSVYGSVYAIADISYSLAYAFGPIVADEIYQKIGFFWLNVGICLSNVLYAPLLVFLKNVYKYNEFETEEDEGYVGEDGNRSQYKAIPQQTDPIPITKLDRKENIIEQQPPQQQIITYVTSKDGTTVPSTQTIVMPQNNNAEFDPRRNSMEPINKDQHRPSHQQQLPQQQQHRGPPPSHQQRPMQQNLQQQQLTQPQQQQLRQRIDHQVGNPFKSGTETTHKINPFSKEDF